MVEQKANDIANNGDVAADVTPRRTRIQSEIEFPYSDLASAGELARVLHAKAGNACDDDELAAWLNQSSNSGTYRARRSAARMFGLIDIAQGRITLTSTGRDIGDAGKERIARVEAFLMPELYRAMYEQCHGHVLPPAAAIERQMEQLGVSPKQKVRARQAFQKSAAYAGFIDQNSGRFVKPGAGMQSRAPEQEAPDKKNKTGSGGGGEGGDDGMPPQHPLVRGLFLSLPPNGDPWTLEEAVDWLQAAASNLRLAYKLKGTITVKGDPPKALTEGAA